MDVTANGDLLHYEGPPDVVTTDLIEAMRLHKLELLQLLTSPADPAAALPFGDRAGDVPTPDELLAELLPADVLPLWLYDRVHPLPGIDPAPAPACLTPEEIDRQVAMARADAAAIAQDWRQRFGASLPAATTPRQRSVRSTTTARDPELMARVLAAGGRLGWPALPLRPGESLGADELSWRTFVDRAPISRLDDAVKRIEEVNHG